MPPYVFYTMVHNKAKMTKNSNEGGGGGPALIAVCYFDMDRFGGSIFDFEET